MMPSKPATTSLVKANKQLARRVKQSLQQTNLSHATPIPIHLLPSISPSQLQRLLSSVSTFASMSPASNFPVRYGGLHAAHLALFSQGARRDIELLADHPYALSLETLGLKDLRLEDVQRTIMAALPEAQEAQNVAYRQGLASKSTGYPRRPSPNRSPMSRGRAGQRALHTEVETRRSADSVPPFSLETGAYYSTSHLDVPPTPPFSSLTASIALRPPSRSSSPTSDPPRQTADNHSSLATMPNSTPAEEPQSISLKQAKSGAPSLLQHELAQETRPPTPAATEDGADEDEDLLDTGRFVFHVGWSGRPKQRPSDDKADEAPTPLPNPFTPSKLNSTCVGEDAFFQLPYALGIADGVGGWSRKGDVRADPRRWGGLLMHFCSEEIGEWAAAKGEYSASPLSNGPAQSTSSVERANVRGKVQGSPSNWKENLSGWRAEESRSAQNTSNRTLANPTLMMQKGYEKCLACFTAEGSRGSSTCLLAVLQDDSLHVANLGDCSLFIIRNGVIVHQTTEMQHAFNWPLQLGTKQKDTPMKDAIEDTWKVEKHDVVVMGSDGLTDNLDVDTITDILATFAPPGDASSTFVDAEGRPPTPPDSRPSSPALPPFCPQKLSDALCRAALEISEELGAETPFMHKAIDNGINFVGGKRDDITVLVGLIGERRDTVSTTK